MPAKQNDDEMNLSDNEISEILARCWRIAANADLEGSPKGIVQVLPDGKEAFNTARYDTYKYLLSALLPQESRDVTVTEKQAKQPWEEQ